jgi:hypothetical protein
MKINKMDYFSSCSPCSLFIFLEAMDSGVYSLSIKMSDSVEQLNNNEILEDIVDGGER